MPSIRTFYRVIMHEVSLWVLQKRLNRDRDAMNGLSVECKGSLDRELEIQALNVSQSVDSQWALQGTYCFSGKGTPFGS